MMRGFPGKIRKAAPLGGKLTRNLQRSAQEQHKDARVEQNADPGDRYREQPVIARHWESSPRVKAKEIKAG
jgi:hypothetical protein